MHPPKLQGDFNDISVRSFALSGAPKSTPLGTKCEHWAAEQLPVGHRAMHDGTTQKWETKRLTRVAQKAAWRLCRSVPAFEAVLESGRRAGMTPSATPGGGCARTQTKTAFVRCPDS